MKALRSAVLNLKDRNLKIMIWGFGRKVQCKAVRDLAMLFEMNVGSMLDELRGIGLEVTVRFNDQI